MQDQKFKRYQNSTIWKIMQTAAIINVLIGNFSNISTKNIDAVAVPNNFTAENNETLLSFKAIKNLPIGFFSTSAMTL